MDEQINIKFRQTLSCQATLKKLDVYNFKFTKEELDEAKKRTFENPLMLLRNIREIFLVYSDKGELVVDLFISHYSFNEGLGKHKLKKTYTNGSSCTCGLFFFDKVKKKGIDYLNEHIKKIEALRWINL